MSKGRRAQCNHPLMISAGSSIPAVRPSPARRTVSLRRSISGTSS